MTWATLLLFIVSIYVAFKLAGLSRKRGRLKFLGLTIAAFILILMQLVAFIKTLSANSDFAAVANFIVEWGHVTSLAFVLSSLAVFIRESKPVFAQFPMLYTGLPLLIVLSYFLVKDTYALKSWLLAIYQGGAIIVSLLMYSIYTYRRNEYAMILSGVTVFLICYLLFWYVPVIQQSYAWSWKLLFAVAMILNIIGYEHTESEEFLRKRTASQNDTQ